MLLYFVYFSSLYYRVPGSLWFNIPDSKTEFFNDMTDSFPSKLLTGLSKPSACNLQYFPIEKEDRSLVLLQSSNLTFL